jgi:hypothetical protein
MFVQLWGHSLCLYITAVRFLCVCIEFTHEVRLCCYVQCFSKLLKRLGLGLGPTLIVVN